MSLKTKIRAHIIKEYDDIVSVHIRGDGVIHAKNIEGKTVYSLRMRDFCFLNN